MRRFLAQDDAQPKYRAVRRLDATNGNRRGWMEVVTEYSPQTGFRYEVTAEGGSGHIRRKVLRAVLDGEREAIESGETSRSSLCEDNYAFKPVGVDPDGLAVVRLFPRRQEYVLVAGTMYLRTGGDLVRLEGRLAKSPSFWVKDVDIVRSYERIGGVVMPVALESSAQLRLLGSARLHMTYEYLEIDGRVVASAAARPIGARSEAVNDSADHE
jgi:hypothetical protein